MEDLPQGTPLALTDTNMALIKRLVGFDVGQVFSKANEFNNEAMDYPSFVFSADTRKERGSSPQRVFQLRAIVHYQSDLDLLVDSIRRNEPTSAVRVIRLCYNKLRSAEQYDPLEGSPNAIIPISA